MFTAKDLSVGDLIATYRLTVTEVNKLPAKIWNHDGLLWHHPYQLYSVKGVSWDTKEIRDYIVTDDRELEVWE